MLQVTNLIGFNSSLRDYSRLGTYFRGMNAERTLLTAATWAGLSPLLPGQAGYWGPTARDTRGLVEAVLWLGHTGVAKRDLPPHLSHWHRMRVRLARRRDASAWTRATLWLICTGGGCRTPVSGRCRQIPPASTSISTPPGLLIRVLGCGARLPPKEPGLSFPRAHAASTGRISTP